MKICRAKKHINVYILEHSHPHTAIFNHQLGH